METELRTNIFSKYQIAFERNDDSVLSKFEKTEPRRERRKIEKHEMQHICRNLIRLSATEQYLKTNSRDVFSYVGNSFTYYLPVELCEIVKCSKGWFDTFSMPFLKNVAIYISDYYSLTSSEIEELNFDCSVFPESFHTHDPRKETVNEYLANFADEIISYAKKKKWYELLPDSSVERKWLPNEPSLKKNMSFEEFISRASSCKTEEQATYTKQSSIEKEYLRYAEICQIMGYSLLDRYRYLGIDEYVPLCVVFEEMLLKGAPVAEIKETLLKEQKERGWDWAMGSYGKKVSKPW
ncbi:hypothetical protein [Amphritea sp.]|uniref:hypothetical protein n=1 Tax=Amphritea sp. TaxID=1872502 RepID=UPI003D0DFF76